MVEGGKLGRESLYLQNYIMGIITIKKLHVGTELFAKLYIFSWPKQSRQTEKSEKVNFCVSSAIGCSYYHFF